jgi:hypothetical protein
MPQIASKTNRKSSLAPLRISFLPHLSLLNFSSHFLTFNPQYFFPHTNAVQIWSKLTCDVEEPEAASVRTRCPGAARACNQLHKAQHGIIIIIQITSIIPK